MHSLCIRMDVALLFLVLIVAFRKIRQYFPVRNCRHFRFKLLRKHEQTTLWDAGSYLYREPSGNFKTVNKNKFTSSVTPECREALDLLSKKYQTTLIWVSGHIGVEGNEIADELSILQSTFSVSVQRSILKLGEYFLVISQYRSFQSIQQRPTGGLGTAPIYLITHLGSIHKGRP